MRYRYLSHLLKDVIPAYGGTSSLGVARTNSISSGGAANAYQFLMGSHWGTHIDAPNHFFENSRKIADYPAEFWIFRLPCVVKVSLAPSEVLSPGKWLESVDGSRDILLLQSGWTECRGKDIYTKENPGIHPDIGICLRKRFPKIRAIGIDWISASPYRDRPLGRQAHKAFLDPEGENEPILIIEDMDLSCKLENLSELLALPLRVDVIDSAPCTVIGGFRD